MAEKQGKKLDKDIMDLVVIALRKLHPHLCMMTQSERDMVNNSIQRWRLYGEEMRLSQKQIDFLFDIAEKLLIKLEA